MSQMIKFFGEPLKEIKSKQSGKMMFRFDSKGEFITDDPVIIERAMGFFDYVPVAPGEVGDRVKKTVVTPPITITTKGREAGNELTTEEIRARAKEKGIKNWHSKKIKNLISELKEG